MNIKKKEYFISAFRNRHPLRIHMSAILLATASSGLLFSKLFLAFSVEYFIIRYPLAVIFSYLIFFICIKLWLLYVSPKRRNQTSNASDWLDLPTPSSGGTSGDHIPTFHGGGGSFDGGGASASIELDSLVAVETPISSISEGASSAADGVGDLLGEVAGPAIAIGVLVVLLVTILGNAIFVFSDAPMILSEAAFEGLLAASLMKKASIIDDENWIGSIFKTTWKPFASICAVSFLAAVALQYYFPEATRLSDIFR
jgi:hypothetical protein